MSVEDIEHEIAEVNQKIKTKETSTPKEGISTWILLGGSNHPTTKPEAPKLEKIARIEHDHYKQQKRPITTSKPTSELYKSKTKVKVTQETDRPVKLNQNKKAPNDEGEPNKIKRKLNATSIATTTTTARTTTISPEKEEPVTFLILEAKESDFNLPQDRSPGNLGKQKKPNTTNNNKNKKKNNNNKKVTSEKDSSNDKNNTKVAVNNKNKEKPMTTKIYNYLAREVMPTVGVGLIGLVVTAGLAGYFFGPFGALRRSYDLADRKDDLYYYNNEEYAGQDGQSEEDIFGKVIAGMPTNSNYRNNIRYQQNQRPNQPNVKYAYNYNRYKDSINRPQQMPYINYQSRFQQPVITKNPVVNPSQKKSISSPVFYQKSSTNSENPSTIISTVKPSSEIPTTIISTTTTSTEKPQPEVTHSNYQPSMSNEFADLSSNELKRRSQFVVGSVLPDVITDDDRLSAALVPEHGPRRRKRSTPVLLVKTDEDELKNIEKLFENLKGKISNGTKNEKISKEQKNIEYQINRLKKVMSEARDIEQFQQEFHIDSDNSGLKEMIRNSMVNIIQDIQFIDNLLKNPTDIDQKLAEHKKAAKVSLNDKTKTILKRMDSDALPTDAEVSTISSTTIKTSSSSISSSSSSSSVRPTTDFTTTDRPSGLMGLLKLLELKAAFGINLMQSVRPAFDRAFQQVFNMTHTVEHR